MLASTPEQAVEQLRRSLQVALSCVTRAVLVPSGVWGETQVLAFPATDEPAPLPGFRGGLSIAVWYRVLAVTASGDPWLAHVTGYAYGLLDGQGRELLAYHWHPLGRNAVRFPHLHVAGRVSPITNKQHLPTGNVALGSIVRFAIDELGVRPLRPDWQTVIEPLLNEDSGLAQGVVHSDPETVSGTPVFVGTRVPVSNLFDYLAGGDSLDVFLDDFPSVGRDQAIAALGIAQDGLLAAALVNTRAPR